MDALDEPNVHRMPSVITAPSPREVLEHRADVTTLGESIIGLAGRMSAATARWLQLIAAFDAAEGCDVWGFPSTARWLMHHCGLARRTAVEHVRVAKALVAFPVLAESMAAGRLSFSQVRAISRVADIAEPSLIEALVMTAEHGSIDQLEAAVRGLRTVDDNEHPDPDAPDELFRQRWEADARWSCSAKLAPEHGAVVDAALSAVIGREEVDRATALVRLAEITLAVVAAADGALPSLRGDEAAAVVVHLHAPAPSQPAAGADTHTADTDTDNTDTDAKVEASADAGTKTKTATKTAADAETDAAAPAAATRSRERDRGRRPGAQPDAARRPAEVRGDDEDRRGRPAPGQQLAAVMQGVYAHLLHGPGLPPRVLRRLACRAKVRLVPVDGAGSPLDLGRTLRLVSDKQFAALMLRDGGCAHPGCGRRTGLEAHHVRHWIDGGPSDLDNLVLLCVAHHHAHHDGEFVIGATGSGRFTFARSDGLPLAPPADPLRVGDEAAPGDAAYDHLATDAATSRWDGTRLDHDFAVSILAQGLRPRGTTGPIAA